MPKKGSENLWQLIRSLTKEEKAYFNSLYGREHAPIHAKVFNRILQQEEYNEKQLMSELKIKPSRLPNIKNYLYHRILDTIETLNKNKTPSSEIRSLISYAELLQHKKLFKQSQRFIQKAKIIANETEYFGYELELIDMELTNGMNGADIKQIKAKRKNAFEEKSFIIKKSLNADEYEKLSIDLMLAGTKYEHPQGIRESSVFKKIMNNKYFADEKKAKSVKAKIDFYHLNGSYNYAIGEYRKAIQYFRKEMDYISSRPLRKLRFFETYIKACNNIIACGNGILSFEKLLFFLNEIKSAIKNKTISSGTDSTAMYYNGFLGVHVKHHRFKEALVIVEDIKDWLKVNDKVLSEGSKNHILFLMGQIYFWNGKLKESLRCINKCMPGRKTSTGLMLYPNVLLFNLVIQYELKNYDIIEPLSLSTRRFLKKNNRISTGSEALINFIRRSPFVNSDTERHELLKKLHAILKQNITSAQFDFDVLTWIESKISNRSI